VFDFLLAKPSTAHNKIEYTNMSTKLCCGTDGHKYKVMSVVGPFRNRLSELGFTKNTIVMIVRHINNKGPIEILIRGYYIILRHDEAECIIVE
jgi:Fe2+ transport system protein FeoA